MQRKKKIKGKHLKNKIKIKIDLCKLHDIRIEWIVQELKQL